MFARYTLYLLMVYSNLPVPGLLSFLVVTVLFWALNVSSQPTDYAIVFVTYWILVMVDISLSKRLISPYRME
jgi:hypothetical protein